MSKAKHGILIIDDEPEILKAIERTLRSFGKIYTATSGAAGLEMINKKAISLVMCDQRMPEMSGVDFFKELIKKDPTIVRIILTGYADIEDLIEAINDVGLYRYVTKPWDNHEIQITVRRALERFELEAHNRDLIGELKQANTELEKKVKKRTQELHQANKKLSNLAITDELTQVGNQRFFRQQLTHEMDRSVRYKHALSLLLVDIDYFKNYNDEYGHAVGDKALKLVATTLKRSIRSTDIIARYGGEEFAILLPETSKKRSSELAERLRKAIHKKKFPFNIQKRSRKGINVSIGLACYPEDYKGKNPRRLVPLADKALYRAKRKGRNRVETL